MREQAPAPSDLDDSAATVPVRWAGLVLGPLAAFAVYHLIPAEALTHAPRVVASLGTLMALWWLTEAVPVAVTSLLPFAILPLCDVGSAKTVASAYADEVVFLFLGGFLLGASVERWGLHKRVALTVISLFGSSPAMLIGGFMLATALISMWVSNTATTMMMMPIGLSVVRMVTNANGQVANSQIAKGQIAKSEGDVAGQRRFAVALVLGIAYAASIGGIGTWVGTPPNTILRGFMDARGLKPVGFAQWMFGVGLPIIAVFLPAAWLLLTLVVFRVPFGAGGIAGLSRDELRREREALGPFSRGEWLTALIFGAAILAWIFRPQLAALLHLQTQNAKGEMVPLLSDAGIAIIASLLMFVIPVEARKGIHVLDWRTFKGIPWHVLLLTGGGLCLADAMTRTGLDAYLATQFAGLKGVPFWVLVLALTAGIAALSELASNAAVTTAALPVLWAAAEGLDMHPYLLIVPATLAASCGFMLPVATPPNGIAYATGMVRGRDMLRAGLAIDIAGVLAITLWSVLMGKWALGV